MSIGGYGQANVKRHISTHFCLCIPPLGEVESHQLCVEASHLSLRLHGVVGVPF